MTSGFGARGRFLSYHSLLSLTLPSCGSVCATPKNSLDRGAERGTVFSKTMKRVNADKGL